MDKKYERPDLLPCRTFKEEFLCENHDEIRSFFFRLGYDWNTRQIVEAFMTVGQAGRCASCVWGGFMRLLSKALQYGVPVREVAQSLKGVICPAAGAGRPSSCIDWMGKVLEKYQDELDKMEAPEPPPTTEPQEQQVQVPEESEKQVATAGERHQAYQQYLKGKCVDCAEDDE